MLTLSAFDTTMPLRPVALPSLTTPNCWSASAAEHWAAPAFVPSTTVVLRSMPRRWTPAVVISTPPNWPLSVEADGFERSAVSL